MAQQTQTQAGEGRALSAALSAPAPFTSRAGAMALHASDRHVDRWAPERDAARRSRGLGSLAFVDRLLQPWMTAAPTMLGARPVSYGAPDVSWVFPRPWYQDELNWMAAQRDAAQQQPTLLTTRGTYTAPQAMMQPRHVVTANGVVVTASELPSQTSQVGTGILANLEYVAPSLSSARTSAAARAGIATASSPVQRAMRAWTPQVSFAAAQAAEVVAGAVALAESAGLTTADRSPMLEGLAYVAPVMLGGEEPRSAIGAAQPSEASSRVAETAQLARTVAQLSAVQAASRATSVETARTAIAETALPAVASARAQTPAAATSAPVAEAAFRAEQLRVIEEIRSARVAPQETVAPSEAMAPPARAAADVAVLAASSPAAAQALRAVELLARSALSTLQGDEPARGVAPVSGPRVALPAGLGGAVVGFEAAQAASHPMLSADTARAEAVRVQAMRPMRSFAPVLTPALASFVGGGEPALGGAPPAGALPTLTVPPGRAFAPVWSAPSAQPALAAVAADRPAAMSHLAWADRWIARLAGASPASLAALDVAGERSIAVPRPLSIGAPEVVFVVPQLLESRRAATPVMTQIVPRAAQPIAEGRRAPESAPTIAPPVRTIPGMPDARIAPELAPPTRSAPRIDDQEETPDAVFAAIARSARPRLPRGAAPEPIATPAPEIVAGPSRTTLADQIAHSAPTAPAAGLHAGLASSPMAAALASIMPLPAAPTFDPRALFSVGLASAYTGGAMARAFTTPAQWMAASEAAVPGGFAARDLSWLPAMLAGLPFVAPTARAFDGAPSIDEQLAAEAAAAGAPISSVASRAPVPSWLLPLSERTAEPRPAESRPAAPGQRTTVARHAEMAAPTGTDAEAPSLASVASPVAAEPASWSVHAPVLAPVALASIDPAVAASIAGLSPAAIARAIASISGSGGAEPTSDDVASEGAAPEGIASAAPTAFPLVAPTLAAPYAALAGVEASGWSPRPGMTAEMAQGFAVRSQRTSADLAFDFVPPELVLAARVYGFGAVEAAQAARLAVAGPAGLSAMASALDLTFLRQLHVAHAGAEASSEARRAEEPRRSEPAAQAPYVPPVASGSPVAPVTAYPTESAAPSGTVFGVPRRLPRGVFHWPAGAVAAMDLHAELPFGAATSTIAALELLAAGAVADIAQLVSPTVLAATSAADGESADGPRARPSAGSFAGAYAAPGADPQRTPFAPFATGPATSADLSGEPEIRDAVVAAESYGVPATERARFASIYVSLSRSNAGQSLSPSVRAARALAIATGLEADGGTSSVQERARAAWSVMPVVFAGDAVGAAEASHGYAASSPALSPALSLVSPSSRTAPDATYVAPSAAAATSDAGPQLSGLSARAGEALGSLVAPTAREVDRASSGAARTRGGPSERSFSEPMIHELVRTGRPFQRTGGGETTIPSWFEGAAKKMLEQRGLSETISVAELTLIASAPSGAIAADSKSSSSPDMHGAAPTGQHGAAQGEKPDVDKLAADVYAAVCELLAVARERNGDPWS